MILAFKNHHRCIGPMESPASIADFHRHELDSHLLLQELPERFVKHMFPDVEAEARFHALAGQWALYCGSHRPLMIGLTDPLAKDEEILAEVWTMPIVLRVRIVR